MDEAEQDTQNYPDQGLNNSVILRKPNSIILLSFIPHEKSAMRVQFLKFMRDIVEKIRGHRMDMANTTFICQGQNLTLTNTRFILSAPKYA